MGFWDLITGLALLIMPRVLRMTGRPYSYTRTIHSSTPWPPPRIPEIPPDFCINCDDSIGIFAELFAPPHTVKESVQLPSKELAVVITKIAMDEPLLTWTDIFGIILVVITLLLGLYLMWTSPPRKAETPHGHVPSTSTDLQANLDWEDFFQRNNDAARGERKQATFLLGKFFTLSQSNRDLARQAENLKAKLAKSESLASGLRWQMDVEENASRANYEAELDSFHSEYYDKIRLIRELHDDALREKDTNHETTLRLKEAEIRAGHNEALRVQQTILKDASDKKIATLQQSLSDKDNDLAGVRKLVAEHEKKEKKLTNDYTLLQVDMSLLKAKHTIEIRNLNEEFETKSLDELTESVKKSNALRVTINELTAENARLKSELKEATAVTAVAPAAPALPVQPKVSLPSSAGTKPRSVFDNFDFNRLPPLVRNQAAQTTSLPPTPLDTKPTSESGLTESKWAIVKSEGEAQPPTPTRAQAPQAESSTPLVANSSGEPGLAESRWATPSPSKPALPPTQTLKRAPQPPSTPSTPLVAQRSSEVGTSEPGLAESRWAPAEKTESARPLTQTPAQTPQTRSTPPTPLAADPCGEPGLAASRWATVEPKKLVQPPRLPKQTAAQNSQTQSTPSAANPTGGLGLTSSKWAAAETKTSAQPPAQTRTQPSLTESTPPTPPAAVPSSEPGLGASGWAKMETTVSAPPPAQSSEQPSQPKPTAPNPIHIFHVPTNMPVVDDRKIALPKFATDIIDVPITFEPRRTGASGRIKQFNRSRLQNYTRARRSHDKGAGSRTLTLLAWVPDANSENHLYWQTWPVDANFAADAKEKPVMISQAPFSGDTVKLELEVGRSTA